MQTHMTNTANTPVEALETYYPIRVRRYARRWGSGGRGRHAGGDGVVREIEFLARARLTVLGDRRRHRPYGLDGGTSGSAGRDWMIRNGRATRLPAKVLLAVGPGDRVRVETPGGGGFGRRTRRR